MADSGRGWGARIFEARAAMRAKTGRKMTQAELAAAVGLSPQQIGFYESETNEPGRDTWVAMAKALRVTPAWLAFGQEPRDVARDVPLAPAKPGRNKRAG